jgi:site-specific DNA recombinase
LQGSVIGMTRLRAAVFSRESKGKGSSIDDQDRENLVACEALDAEVAVTLRDTVGASRFTAKQRVGWPEITELVQSGRIDLLVVWEVSRADRTMDTWVPFVSACAKNGVRLHITSLEMTYDPRKAAHRKALMDMGSSAEHETGQLSERSRKGIRGAAAAGKAHGRSAFGYDRRYEGVVNGKMQFTEVPNEHIGIPVEIITRIARRESQSSIVRDLNGRKAGGRKWSIKILKYIATNPTYIGMRRHRTDPKRREPGELHPGNWPPASNDPDWEATFWRAQKVLAGPKARNWAQPSPTALHLLSYLMTCTNCKDANGNPAMVTPGYVAQGDRKERQRRYRCREGCTTIEADVADEFVVRLLLRRLAKSDARALFARSTVDLAAHEAEVARLEEKLEEARQAYDDDVISAEAFGRKEKALLAQIAEAQGRVRAAREVDLVAEFLGTGEFTEQVGRPRFEAMTVPLRRELLKGVFRRISLAPTDVRLSRHATQKDRLLLAAKRITVDWAKSGSCP